MRRRKIKAHGLLSWIGRARARRAVPTPRCAHGSRWAAEGGGVIGRHGGPRRRRRRRPAQSARPPRAARVVAGQGAELRVVCKQRRVPRPERATTPITMRPTTMRLRPPAPGDAAKAERKAGVERARVHARFGTAPLRVRVAARQARVGRLPHVRRRCRLLILFAHHLAPHGHGRGGGLKPAATNLEHCASCCCCQNGRASGPACKGTEKVTDNGDSTPHACRGDGRPRATEARRQRLRASFGASQRVLAAGLSPPPRTHRRLWNRRGRRASLRSEASLASAWRPS